MLVMMAVAQHIQVLYSNHSVQFLKRIVAFCAYFHPSLWMLVICLFTHFMMTKYKNILKYRKIFSLS